QNRTGSVVAYAQNARDAAHHHQECRHRAQGAYPLVSSDPAGDRRTAINQRRDAGTVLIEDGAQLVREPLFIRHGHAVTPPSKATCADATSGPLIAASARSFASALLVWLFTVPMLQPSVSATCASVMSSKNRSTRTARWRDGRRPSAGQSRDRSSTVAVPSAIAASGRSPWVTSRVQSRRRHETNVVAMILRTYASGASSSRGHANHAFISAVCSRSSASPQSRVSRYATRRSRGDRVTTNSSYPVRSAIGRLSSSSTVSQPLRSCSCPLYAVASPDGCPIEVSNLYRWDELGK